jgi:hypothetical protein
LCRLFCLSSFCVFCPMLHMSLDCPFWIGTFGFFWRLFKANDALPILCKWDGDRCILSRNGYTKDSMIGIRTMIIMVSNIFRTATGRLADPIFISMRSPCK